MRFLSGRFVIGIIVVVVGVLLLLDNLVEEIRVDMRQILQFWPLIPLVLGLNWLLASFGAVSTETGKKTHFSWGQFITALIAIAVGVIFLGRNLDLFYIDTSMLFNIAVPLILILIGVNLLRGRAQSAGGGGRFAFMGGAEVGGSRPWKLESGSYFAFMGGIEMDLTAAELPEGETLIDLTAIMGGIEVKIPKDMPVIFEGSVVLGGVTFIDQEDGGIIGGRKIEHNLEERTTKYVRLQGRAMMGGIEVKEAL
ncbi:MAG: cell wall-active antibiotics response protein [Bacillota bacterium]